jgi:DNA invertase Pin-like site-specific DNA recombinase
MSQSNGNGNGLQLTGDGAAYVRVSGDKQDVTRQYDDLAAFERRNGVTVAREHRYEDDMPRDLSARRPDFQRLLRAARAGEVQWVWVQRIDRFGVEDGDELVALRRELRLAGCRLIDDAGTDWTNRDLLTLIRAGLAGEQSRAEQVEKSFRSLDGMVKKARDGDWQGGPPKLGFDVACFDRSTGRELWRVVWEGRDLLGWDKRGEGLPPSAFPDRKKARAEGYRPAYHLRRRKDFPDGTSERFDGNVIFRTSKDTQALRIVPTQDEAKLAATRGVFRRYATEAVTFFGLAKWLNDQGIRNSCGRLFQSRDISKMLTDEAYLGYATFGKRRTGRFHRHDADGPGGGIRELEPELRGRDTASDPADVVRGSARFETIVDRPTFDAVQRKLRDRRETQQQLRDRETQQLRQDGRTRTVRPNACARKPDLYLSGLLVCGVCGKAMTAQSSKGGYLCSTWDNHRVRGALANSPCRRNGVKHALLDAKVEEALGEELRRLHLLLREPDAPDPREGQADRHWKAFQEGLDRLIHYLWEHCPEDYDPLVAEEEQYRAEMEEAAGPAGEGGEDPLGPRERAARTRQLDEAIRKYHEAHKAGGNRAVVHLPGCLQSLLALYRANWDPAGLSAEIKALKAELAAKMEEWRDLPKHSVIQEQAGQELTELAARIEARRADLRDAASEVEGNYREAEALHLDILDALAARRRGVGPEALRRRAEALRRVLDRVEVGFEATGNGGRGGPGNAHSKPVALTFHLRGGGDIKVAVGQHTSGGGRSQSHGKP